MWSILGLYSQNTSTQNGIRDTISGGFLCCDYSGAGSCTMELLTADIYVATEKNHGQNNCTMGGSTADTYLVTEEKHGRSDCAMELSTADVYVATEEEHNGQ